MRLIYYNPGHHKNTKGIELMCASRGIDLVITRDSARLKQPDYEIVIIVYTYIDPSELPPNVYAVYGPQTFIFPEAPFLGPLREEWGKRYVHNFLSQWVLTYIQEFGSLIMPSVCFPFAVDVDRFCSSGEDKTLDCIVYVKHREPGLVNRGLEIIRQKGISHKVFTYGSYSEENYVNTLKTAKFMITFDAHESQGFAIQEAMSCGVPLIVLDVASMFDEYNGSRQVYSHLRGHKKLLATSTPYWSDKCGIKIENLDDLPASIDRMMVENRVFKPREFILENLSPTACMDRILHFFGINSTLE